MKTVAKYLIISLFFTAFISFAPHREAKANVVYTDSITFKIDSAKIVGNNLVYSIMFYRHVDDWRGAGGLQDTLMGDVDLYFWMNDMVFNKDVFPTVSRKHPNIDHSQDFLRFERVDYYAGRFQVKLAKNTAAMAPKYIEIPYNTPVELCQIQMPLNYVDRNPGFRWDTVATGGFSNIGEPLEIAFKGDILQNPDPAIVLEDYAKKVYVCEGYRTKIWAKGFSAGEELSISWLMSKDKNFTNPVKFTSNITGTKVGTSQVHYTGSVITPDGTLSYEVSSMNVAKDSRVDTLMILNAPQWLDSMYFQCVLSDPSLSVGDRKSLEGETQVIVRDSIFGWFAASDPNNRADVVTGNPIGANNRTDTILKCPTGVSYVSFFFFGPDCGEDAEFIGNEMVINYMTQDALANRKLGSVNLTSWAVEAAVKAPNGKCLFRGTVNLPDSVSNVNVWVTSISTAKGCDNGAPYVLYDTVHIRDIEGDVNIKNSLADTTVSSGEKMELNTDYVYSGYELKSALGSLLELSTNPKYYQASSVSCTNPLGCADTLVYKYDISTPTGTCTMEVNQIIHISDWYYVALKVFLEGAYRSSTGNMKTYYSDNDLLPHVSPYDNTIVLANFPAGKAIVDWIQVSLRQENDVTEVVGKSSVFLLEDGSICDSLGNPYVKFKNLKPSDYYYVVIEHRNHIITRSKCAYNISALKTIPTIIDLSDIANVAGGAVKLLGTGIYGLYVGDVNQDNMVGGGDKSKLIAAVSQAGYVVFDLDFDGIVGAVDRRLLLKNSPSATGMFDVGCRK